VAGKGAQPQAYKRAGDGRLKLTDGAEEEKHGALNQKLFLKHSVQELLEKDKMGAGHHKQVIEAGALEQ